jgi:hypothetical protein
MKQILGVVVVALTAVLNMYVAIPAGYAFDLSPLASGIAALVGSVGGTVAMVFAGDRIMPRVRGAYRRVRSGTERDEEEPSDPDGGEAGRTQRIADRFGAPGVGLIGPMTIGGFASAISGVAIGIPKAKLALWIAIGQTLVVVIYSLLLDTAVA